MTSKEVIGPCVICAEPATGHHYGVVSCLGCKVFFRRAVVQRQDVHCQRSEECGFATQNARKSCRSCRFRRCLDQGMQIEALKPRRDAILCRRQRKSLQNRNSSEGKEIPSTSRRNGCGGREELLAFMRRLVQVDSRIRDSKLNHLRVRREAQKLADEVESRQSTAGSDIGEFRIALGADVTAVVQAENFAALSWARSLSAWRRLCASDRSLLLHRFAVHHLVLEHGLQTARTRMENSHDIWLISNGACMPRTLHSMSAAFKASISEDRKWRQEKLYRTMTETCIDEVAQPLRALQLDAEEVATLKVILLFLYGHHTYRDKTLDEGLSESGRRLAMNCRDRAVAALFEHYLAQGRTDCAERFGNVLLLVSGVCSAAAATKESFQVMRLFKFAAFDTISETLLFNAD